MFKWVYKVHLDIFLWLVLLCKNLLTLINRFSEKMDYVLYEV